MSVAELNAVLVSGIIVLVLLAALFKGLSEISKGNVQITLGEVSKLIGVFACATATLLALLTLGMFVYPFLLSVFTFKI